MERLQERIRFQRLGELLAGIVKIDVRLKRLWVRRYTSGWVGKVGALTEDFGWDKID